MSKQPSPDQQPTRPATTDRRVLRSRRVLADALIALILEKGYDDITIKDITDRADVSHATFYRHYKDKDELLALRLQEVISELKTLMHESTYADAERELLFKHVDENAALYLILLTSYSAFKVRKHVEATIAAMVAEKWTAHLEENQPTVPIPILAQHIAASMLAMIEWWLVNDRPYSIQQMAAIYHEVISKPTHELLGAKAYPSHSPSA